jgi:hypothetical protein
MRKKKNPDPGTDEQPEKESVRGGSMPTRRKDPMKFARRGHDGRPRPKPAPLSARTVSDLVREVAGRYVRSVRKR